MHDSRARFKYSLESLLKKRSLDLDQLSIEQRQVSQALDEKSAELEVAAAVVADLENEIRKVQQENSHMDPVRIASMTLYLDHQRSDLETMTGQLRQLEEIFKQITEQVRKIRQSIKSLEKNRTMKEKKFNMAQQRSMLIEMDNLWLTKRSNS